jgi:L-alanine-DL-glutamate epimerase-like enolase superfamily enzyme
MEMAGPAVRGGTRIEHIEVSVFRVPTDAPEADGTFAWDSTTMVLVEIAAGGCTGTGYTYADAAAAHLVRDTLAPVIRGKDPLDIPGCWQALTARAFATTVTPGYAGWR